MKRVKDPTPDLLAKAKSMYVFGVVNPDGKRVFPTLRKVSRMTGVPFLTLARLAEEENWKEERYHAYREAYDRIREEMIAKYVQEGARFEQELLQGATIGLRIINARISQIALAVNEQGRVPADPKTTAVKAWEMRDLTFAMEVLKRIGLEIMGRHQAASEVSWSDIARMARGEGIADQD